MHYFILELDYSKKICKRQTSIKKLENLLPKTYVTQFTEQIWHLLGRYKSRTFPTNFS